MTHSALSRDSPFRVWEVKALRGDFEELSRKLLLHVAHLVEPLMKRRRWQVMVLTEFSPKNANLLGLNINRGKEIKLRLRIHGQKGRFFPLEHVLGTMLHELTHIDYGPHNDLFHKALKDLEKEYDMLFVNGASGQLLGGRQSHKRTAEMAAEAAEKRARTSFLVSNCTRKVGGDKCLSEILSPGQAAAIAAERRRDCEGWCGMETYEEDQNLLRGSTGDRNNTQEDGKSKNDTSMDGVGSLTERLESEELWTCLFCSLFNKPLALQCDACSAVRPSDAQGSRKQKLRSWSCNICTLLNDGGEDFCAACKSSREIINLT